MEVPVFTPTRCCTAAGILQRPAAAAASATTTPRQAPRTPSPATAAMHTVHHITGESAFEHRTTLRWTPQAGAVIASSATIGSGTILVVDAFVEESGELFKRVGFASRGSHGACLIDSRLKQGLKVRFGVRVQAQGTSCGAQQLLPCPLLADFDDHAEGGGGNAAAAVVVERRHELTNFSPPVRIGAKQWGAVALNARAQVVQDAEALRLLLRTPRRARHGKWSCQYHIGAMRSLHARGLGLIRTPRLTKLAHAPGGLGAALLRAVSDVANTAPAMRRVLRYAMPYSTPSESDLAVIRHIVSSEVDDCRGITRLLHRDGLDPNQPRGLLINTARRGMVNTVLALVDAGADVNMPAGVLAVRALHMAAANGKEAMVRVLIAAGAEVNSTQNRAGDSCTALHRAAHEGKTKVAEILLNAGANIHALTESDDAGDGDRNALTPLWLASESGHESTVKLLLMRGAHPIDVAPDGRSVLWVAAGGGYLGIVRAIINRILSTPPDDEVPSCFGGGVLARSRSTPSAIAELDRTGRMPGSDHRAMGYVSPLMCAAHHGHLTVVGTLLAAGANQDCRAQDGATPLFRALCGGHLPVVEMLLRHGADATLGVQDGASYVSPILIAAGRGYLSVVFGLLQRGITADGACSNDLEGRGERERARADTPILTGSGGAASASASMERVNVRADITAVVVTEDTPLVWAAEEGHVAVVQLLLQHGANVNSADRDACTPLWWAAARGHITVARLLLNAGADATRRGCEGLTPLEAALDRGFHQVVALLKG